MDVAAAMSGKEIYLQNLEVIERIARYVARKNFLSPEEADDFTQDVHLRLIENDYAVLGQFEGKSKVSTYLTTVIVHRYSELQEKLWGKWRPRAETERMGAKAILLERLLTRDGYSFEEAVSMLTTPAGLDFTRAELEWIYQRLPVRVDRQRPLSIDDVPEPVNPTEADDPVEASERARLAARLKQAIEKELERFAPPDGLILTLRFWNGLTMRAISAIVDIDQKKLFRHVDKLLAELCRRLEDAGFTKSEVADFLSHHDQEVNIDPGPGLNGDRKPGSPEGNPSSGPSHKRRGKRGGEETPK